MEPKCKGEKTVKPVLVFRIAGMMQGSNDGKCQEQREEYFAWYDNKNKTYTKKKILIVETIWPDKEEIITTKINIETIKDNEYFKRKLSDEL